MSTSPNSTAQKSIRRHEIAGLVLVIVMAIGVGGWAGIGLAAGLTDPEDGSGAVGGFASLSSYTSPGGSLTAFSLP